MKKIILLIILLNFFLINLCANDSWIVKNFPDTVQIMNIAINSANTIFVTTMYDPNDKKLPVGLVYYSTNDGNNWIQVNPGAYFPEILDILIDDNDNIYLGTWYGGIIKSIDNGVSWEVKNNGLSNSVPFTLASTSEGAIYAGQYWGGDIDNTIDGGEEWIQLAYSTSGIKGMGINSSDYIFVDGNKYSVNNGNTWITIENGLPNHVLINQVCYSFNIDNETFLGTVEGVYFLNPMDSIWVKILSTSRITDMIISSGNEIFAGTIFGTYYSGNNGFDWQNIDEQFSNSPPRTFCFDSDGYLWAASYGTIYKSQRIITDTQSKLSNSKEINIFPNPFNGYLQIEFDNLEIEDLRISIYSIDGVLVKHLINNILNINSIRMYLNELEPGIYIVNLENKKSVIKTEKLIKQ